MSWLEAVAYGPFCRANGIRVPPSTATRRGLEFIGGCSWIGLLRHRSLPASRGAEPCVWGALRGSRSSGSARLHRPSASVGALGCGGGERAPADRAAHQPWGEDPQRGEDGVVPGYIALGASPRTGLHDRLGDHI